MAEPRENGHGGARRAINREISHEQRLEIVAEAERLLAERLRRTTAALLAIADGYQIVQGRILRSDTPTNNDGTPVLDEQGKPKQGNIVPVSAKEQLAAGRYIMDRLLGKPTERVEQQLDATVNGPGMVIELDGSVLATIAARRSPHAD